MDKRRTSEETDVVKVSTKSNTVLASSYCNFRNDA